MIIEADWITKTTTEATALLVLYKTTDRRRLFVTTLAIIRGRKGERG